MNEFFQCNKNYTCYICNIAMKLILLKFHEDLLKKTNALILLLHHLMNCNSDDIQPIDNPDYMYNKVTKAPSANLYGNIDNLLI